MPESAADIVDQYLSAIARHDGDAARVLLDDQEFHFISPIARLDDAEAFERYLDGVGAILQRMKTRHRFEEDGTVVHVLDVTSTMDGYSTQPVVHIAQVVDGRIRRIEVIFDATEYHRMIEDGR